jgi:hypothetical protein
MSTTAISRRERCQDERRSYFNIIVMCPTHHHYIDYIAPDDYSRERLRDMKERHESRANSEWATDAELTSFAALILLYEFGVDVSATAEDTGITREPASVSVTAPQPTVRTTGNAVPHMM